MGYIRVPDDEYNEIIHGNSVASPAKATTIAARAADGRPRRRPIDKTQINPNKPTYGATETFKEIAAAPSNPKRTGRVLCSMTSNVSKVRSAVKIATGPAVFHVQATRSPDVNSAR